MQNDTTNVSVIFERESKFAINVWIDGDHAGQIETDPIQSAWVTIKWRGETLDREVSSVDAAKVAVMRFALRAA